ncbi:MAG: DUF4129 domain-containing protein [Anaerolineae bacterium]|nr:DUF4129 domain-containing protein [Anaerolineae bacterium]
MNRQKLTIFVLLAGAAVLIFVLAVSLGQVGLLPGQPFKLPHQSAFGTYGAEESSLGRVFLLVVRGLLAMALILAPVSLIVMLFSKRGRKQLLGLLVTTSMLLMLIMMVRRIPLQEATIPAPTEEALLSGLELAEGGEVDGPVFAADPPEWTTWAASLVIAVFLAGISTGIALLLLRRREPSIALELLAEEAQAALDRIEMGEDLRETILRCYREMMQVVKEARGIVREQHVTPREFEIVLARKGLPAESLLRLTRLFEEVRYGGRPASSQEEQLAILCLRDIVAACRGGEPREA